MWPYPDRVSKSAIVTKMVGCCLLAGVLLAGLLFPIVGTLGQASNRAADTIANAASQLLEGKVPEITTMTDVNGKPIAYLYDQRRVQVGYNDISPNMIRSIISIEDRRFLDHDGVDWRGTARAFVKNTGSGEVQQGASTLDQQYVKNYQLLVLATTEAERRAATETTPARKLREARMALTLERSLVASARAADPAITDADAKLEAKKGVVTRYLNLVPFGNGAYGIEEAAQTYFRVPAKELTVAQSAMLAGIVQSSSKLDPYTNAKEVTERRNLVLDTLISNFPEQAAEYAAAKQAPLGVKPPRQIRQGCIAAGDAGFYCDYALQFLAANGLSKDDVVRGGYTIRTNLDPTVQASTVRALQANADPQLDGVAAVMSVVRPGKTSHAVVSMGSSRHYGLDPSRGQTVQPQPYSLVGDGAGSVFKIFTVGAAMDRGMGTSARLQVPGFYIGYGMGSSGGLNGCPGNAYCVRNAGRYPASMTVTDALAQSPNTAFVKLIEQTGVAPTVDLAVKLGLRSYATPGTAGQSDKSIAQTVKDGNLGSFTLGPEAVNPLELSNVAATLASGGVWCPPNPIREILAPKRDRFGNQVIGTDGKPAMEPVTRFKPPACEQVVPPELANTLAVAMSKDDVGAGTSAGAARAAGWSLPMAGKTGTTEASRSAAFLGFTNNVAAATYIYGDGPNPTELCTSPLRQCPGYGDLFGGREPAAIWFDAVSPVADNWGPTVLPPTDPKYVCGDSTVSCSGAPY